MRTGRFRMARYRWAVIPAVLLTILLCVLLLAGCGGSTPTPVVLVVTATFTPEPVIVVVTATFTPVSQGMPSSPSTPAPGVISSNTPLPPPEQPSQTPEPPPPTVTPIPTKSAPTLVIPKPTHTLTAPEPTPTAAAQKSTEAPALPEPTPTLALPEDKATAEPTARPASLRSYFVVYTGYQGPDLQDYSLWGMNGDGSDVFKVEGAGQASEPAFSPDGTKLAFYHWTDGLYIWDLVKETLERVVGNTESSFVTWSPNGKRLAYADLTGQPQLYIVNADGSDNHPLTPGLRPNWSLKGGFIAYDTCENNKCGIFRINPDGGGKRQLTDDSGGGAAVSPDGRRIAYWSQADGDFELYVINADGSGKRQLTNNRGNDALPTWSPDGRVIYYLSDQNGTAWAVMAMDGDGSNPRNIRGTSASTDPQRGWQYQRITTTWNE